MAESFTVDASGLARMAKGYAAAGPIVAEETRNAVTRCLLVVEGQAKRYVAVDTGHLRRSLTTDVRPYTGGVRGLVGTNVPYAEVVERGRRAGAPMPPRGALTAWMGRHGFPDDASEYVLRRAISVRGVAARPYLIKAFNEQRPRFAAEFVAAERRVFARIVAAQQ